MNKKEQLLKEQNKLLKKLVSGVEQVLEGKTKPFK